MDKVKARSYPVREWGGFVWAWLGDKADMPEFQPPPLRPPRTRRSLS